MWIHVHAQTHAHSLILSRKSDLWVILAVLQCSSSPASHLLPSSPLPRHRLTIHVTDGCCRQPQSYCCFLSRSRRALSNRWAPARFNRQLVICGRIAVVLQSEGRKWKLRANWSVSVSSSAAPACNSSRNVYVTVRRRFSSLLIQSELWRIGGNVCCIIEKFLVLCVCFCVFLCVAEFCLWVESKYMNMLLIRICLSLEWSIGLLAKSCQHKD